MSSARPEWLSMLEKQIKENPKFVSYALSTLSPEGKPKVRFVIHRGVTPSGLLLTTTDTRMQKPNHLVHDPTLEIAWWIEETAVQFRLTGRGYAVPPDAEGTKKAIETIGVEGEEQDVKWWDNKREQVWGDFSGHLRGSFGRPPPGRKLEDVKEKPEDWTVRLDPSSDDPKQKKDIERALSNFALIAINVEEAEVLELKPVPNVRTQYKKQADGSWNKISVCP